MQATLIGAFCKACALADQTWLRLIRPAYCLFLLVQDNPPTPGPEFQNLDLLTSEQGRRLLKVGCHGRQDKASMYIGDMAVASSY